ncbi:MAG: adenylyl-sulfate kinase [Pseudomonadota bacterium]
MHSLFYSASPFTVWFTGLSGAGKSTLAEKLQSTLSDKGRIAMILDGDVIRKGISQDLGFDASSRAENLRRIAHMAKLLNRQGVDVICATISPLTSDRLLAQSIIGSSYIEIYVSTPLETCEQRDPKGLYKLARAGKIKEFTGISAPYDPPLDAININTVTTTASEAIQNIIRALDPFLNGV